MQWINLVDGASRGVLYKCHDVIYFRTYRWTDWYQTWQNNLLLKSSCLSIHRVFSENPMVELTSISMRESNFYTLSTKFPPLLDLWFVVYVWDIYNETPDYIEDKHPSAWIIVANTLQYLNSNLSRPVLNSCIHPRIPLFTFSSYFVFTVPAVTTCCHNMAYGS